MGEGTTMKKNPYQDLPTEIHSAKDLRQLSIKLSLALGNMGMDSIICLSAGNFGTHVAVDATNDALPKMLDEAGRQVIEHLQPFDPYRL
jgi:hypothetical protein